ncbi:hypothetical protein [Bradyrhizobium sp. RDM4]|uniref:hypothetical protein n=1 Tax=Bradyrhizobium sp. RDM4 TaxID=3378765 RepID=UPI0038FC5AFA
MTIEVEAYLASLNGAAPDMADLARLGVPLSEAVAICAAAYKQPEPLPLPLPLTAADLALPRFALDPEFKLAEVAPAEPVNLNLAMYMPPVPRLAAHREAVHELSALSLLHTLSSMVESGRADINVLLDVGFSLHTAEELCNLIGCAHPFHVTRSSA